MPNVRVSTDATSLREAGFIAISAGFESIAEIAGDWEGRIRASHGGFYLYELKNAMRRADEVGDLQAQPLREASDEMLSRLGQLFVDHEVRYGHQYHLFTTRLLRLFQQDPELGPKAVIAERQSKSGRTLQGMLWIETEDGIYYLTHASDRRDIDPKVNLYKASYAYLYRRANNLGLRSVNMGRGNTEQKRRLGAGLQYQQNHWVYPGTEHE